MTNNTFNSKIIIQFSAVDKKKIGGGSAIFISKDYSEYDIILQYSDEENSITSIRVKATTKHFIITCIYRSPTANNNSTEIFFQILSVHLDTIGNENHYCLGDFNINTINDSTLNNKYISIMQSYGLFICDKNTVTRAASSTCIDHIHTNNVNHQIQIQYAPYDMLDHKIIFVELIDTSTSIRDLKITSKSIKIINQIQVTKKLKEKINNINIKYDEYTYIYYYQVYR